MTESRTGISLPQARSAFSFGFPPIGGHRELEKHQPPRPVGGLRTVAPRLVFILEHQGAKCRKTKARVLRLQQQLGQKKRPGNNRGDEGKRFPCLSERSISFASEVTT